MAAAGAGAARGGVRALLYGCWGDMFRVKTPRYVPEDVGLGAAVARQHAPLDLFNTGLYGVMVVGIFSLSGIVVKDFAGPSAILSVSVATLAVIFTGQLFSFSSQFSVSFVVQCKQQKCTHKK